MKCLANIGGVGWRSEMSIAKILDTTIKPVCCNCDEHVRLVAEAVAAERERCARIAEGVYRTEDRRWVPESLYDVLRRETAADIRGCAANGR
jgi:hypothetical protein